MPNWCTCIMLVSGEIDELQRFVTQAVRVFHKKEGNVVCPFAISAFLPCPEELLAVTYPVKVITVKQYAEQKKGDFIHGITEKMQREFIRKYGYDNWYDWCCAKWGTKWDVSDCTVTRVNHGVVRDTIRYRFTTAWTPPIEALKVISTKFPELSFTLRYVGEGDEFRGTAEFHNGLIRDDCRELDAATREELGVDDEEEDRIADENKNNGFDEDEKQYVLAVPLEEAKARIAKMTIKDTEVKDPEVKKPKVNKGDVSLSSEISSENISAETKDILDFLQ